MLVHDRQEAFHRLVLKLTSQNRHDEIEALGDPPIGPENSGKPIHQWTTHVGTYTVHAFTGIIDLPQPPPITQAS
jgi:hypothetical protein